MKLFATDTAAYRFDEFYGHPGGTMICVKDNRRNE